MKNLEKTLAEEPVIKKLQQLGWRYVRPDELKRYSFEEPLLIDELERKIKEINSEKDLTDEDIEEVIKILKNAFYDQNGHKQVLRYLKYGIEIKTKQRIVRKVDLFDYKNISKNEFVVTNQFKFTAKESIRLDILLFVNGIPLVNIECKNPYTLKTDYHAAYYQIKRYEKDAPELYKYVQIGVVFAEKVKYFPIVPWEDNVEQHTWRWEGCKNEIEAIFEFLKPEMLLDIIRNFLFIKQQKGKETKKVIARYMQVRAVNKIYKRVFDNLEGKDKKNKGLIWHWQGSGKTLTMIFAAHKLYFDLGKPTIFFVVDRRDLERQFGEYNLNELDLNFEYEKVESIPHLVEILRFDNYSGKRGVFLTLIHKFNVDDEILLNEFLSSQKEVSKRKDIVCFLDEVHRSQYGLLAAKMKNILKNAFFFGFTGTPISEKERNTYLEFGYPVEDNKELYLDRYFIDEAIKDGYVLNIVYLPKREKDILLKREDIEWFLKQVDVDDMEDEYEQIYIKESVKKRLNAIKVFLENEQRIEKICKDISEHYKNNFDNKFKGLIVTASRLACVKYKKIIDRYLPSDYTEVVMTFGFSEGKQEIDDYKNYLINKYANKDINEINKKIIEDFQNKQNPKLLIVTDMLITGFDEPKLAVLYLDKLLKRHRLLQTISRTNRPYKDIKEAGLVVDYVGIFELWIEALKYYTRKKLPGIIAKDELVKKFLEIIKELKDLFGDMVGKFEKDVMDKALEMIVTDDEIAQVFIDKVKELRKIFELLGIVKEKIEHIVEYKWFLAIYEAYIKLRRPDVSEEEINKYLERTLKIIHELIEVKPISELSPPFMIDVNYLEKLRKSKGLTDYQKAVGIISGLEIIIRIHSANPVYRAIAEKVKKLIKDWKDKVIDYKKLFEEGIKLVEYLKEKEEEKKKYDEIVFGIKTIFENVVGFEENLCIELAKDVHLKIKNSMIPNWKENNAILNDIKRKIREYLTDVKTKYQISYEDMEKIYDEIIVFITETNL
ncbi:MAG: HsdR family type I site-specific deoxyribonuclease [Endomicrobiia bacterium]